VKLLLALLAKGGIGKVLTSGGTMLISMAVYAIGFGWPYAVGFVLLILVHELGHFIAARQSGLEVGAPVFIPFVGAWIALKDTRMAPATEAHVALAGPMLGSIAAFACYLLALAGQGRIFMALAQAGFMINLFNLIPLHPLDGGRLAGVISPRLWLIGAPMLVALFLWRPSPLLLLVAVAAAPQVWRALKGDVSAHETLPDVRQKLSYGAQYLGLAGALAVMAYEAHEWMIMHGAAV
jgi:Zn-dependent protease